MEVDSCSHTGVSSALHSSEESGSESAMTCDNSDEQATSSRYIRRDLPDWCTAPVYNRYWNHRMKLEQWFSKHAQVTESTSPSHSHSGHFNDCTLYTPRASSALTQYYYTCMTYWQQRYYALLAQSQPRMGRGCIDYGQGRGGFLSPGGPPMQRTQSPRAKESLRRTRTLSTCSSTEVKSSPSKRSRVKPKGNKPARAEFCGHTSDIVFAVDSKLLQGSREEEVVECHMQITDEMLEFFAQSAKHRKERDEQKKREEAECGKAEETFIDISKVGKGSTKATTAAPAVRPGQRRTAEMRLLYGKGAAMIHGMETAMQLNYDRNLDLRQPKPWPHLPLNILFK